MTTDEEALLLALEEDPGDLLARAAYADWLEEQGRDAEAGFVRSWGDAHPLYSPIDECWRWYCRDWKSLATPGSPLRACIDRDLWHALEGHVAGGNGWPKLYRSFEEAMWALAAAKGRLSRQGRAS